MYDHVMLAHFHHTMLQTGLTYYDNNNKKLESLEEEGKPLNFSVEWTQGGSNLWGVICLI